MYAWFYAYCDIRHLQNMIKLGYARICIYFDYFIYPLWEQASYEEATRGPIPLSPFWGLGNDRCIYIANFAIFKIATFWSYHLHLRKKSWSFSFTKHRDFLVGSAHVRSQATVHAFMHAAHAVCMRAEDIPTEVPKVTWWKIAIFLAMFRECLCVVARQLAPKCRNFSNVAKLASRCKWPWWLSALPKGTTATVSRFKPETSWLRVCGIIHLKLIFSYHLFWRSYRF